MTRSREAVDRSSTPTAGPKPEDEAEVGPSISVVILALDEAERLAPLLASLPERWEVVVADGGSRDDTRRIAREHGARVVDQDHSATDGSGGNFDVARNAAARETRGEWTLFLDADERLPPALVDEIERAIRRHGPTSSAAFSIPRQNLYWGKPCRALGSDRQIRLVRRGRGRWEGSRLHRPMVVDGEVTEIDQPMIHENVRRWADVVRRTRRYVPHEARSLDRPSLRRLIAEPAGHFRHYYLENQAWRDGVRGLLVSGLYAFERAAALLLARFGSRTRA